jgi:hypothetical protein
MVGEIDSTDQLRRDRSAFEFGLAVWRRQR